MTVLKQHQSHIRHKQHIQSATNDTDHGGVARSKADRFGYYANNSGYSTYLSGHERDKYVSTTRKFDSYDKSHGLSFMDKKGEDIDQADGTEKESTGATGVAVSAPVVEEYSIENRSREQQRLVSAMQKKGNLL